MLVTLDNEGAFAHSFGRAAPFRVGVEEELFLVDPATHGVTLATDLVLECGEPCVLGEMCDGVIELATPVCDTAGEARDRLGALRATVAPRRSRSWAPACIPRPRSPTSSTGRRRTTVRSPRT